MSTNCVTPNGLGYHGYKWRVRARDSKGAISDWSESWNFNIESGDVTVTDIHFDIPSPSSSEYVRVFAATSGCGGTNIGLRVMVNTANDGTTNGQWNIIYELGVPILTEENAPTWDTRPYEDGTHLVRVLAKGCTDATWEDGSFKDQPYVLQRRKPSWPPPQTPVNGAWLSTRNILFRWDPAIRANSYRLWVSFNPNPEISPFIDQTLGPDTLSYSHTFGQDHNAVYWKIRAINELGYNESVTYKFGIDLVPPMTAIEPMPDTIHQSSFVIRWSGSDASSGIRWYDVQVRDTLQSEWQILREATTETAMIFTGLPGHQYCFRTRGLDIAGNWEEYPGGDGDQCITIDLTSKPVQEWWDPAYQYQRDLVILNNDSSTMPIEYPLRLVFDQNTNPTANQIYNASLSTNKGDDVRIVYNGVEIPRFVKTFTSNQIEIWFDTQAPISGLNSDNTHYQMYYGNPSATSPNFGVNDVFHPKKDSNTVGLWHFQEGSGKTIYDNSGNAHHGTVIGNPQWMLGSYGHFLNFNRISPNNGDYVNLGSINLTNFTLEAWINLHNLDSSGAIISKWGGSGNNAYNFAIWNRKLGIQLSGPGGNRELQSQELQPAIGKWQHVAATYNGNVIRLYVNGNLVAEKADSGGVHSTSTPTVVSRSNDGGGIWYFKGGINHVRISNVARTSFPYASLPGITQLPSIQVSEQITYEPPVEGNADLAIDHVAVYPLSLDQGGGALVEVTLTNLGDRPTQNGFFTDLYLDHLPTGPGDHNNKLHLWVAASIDPGETIILTTTLTEPLLRQKLTSSSIANAATAIIENSGILYSQADSTGVVAEPDNNNNIYATGANICFASEDLFENDNTPASSSFLSIGQTQEHNFSHPGDEDWVKFAAIAGKTYIIQTQGLAPSADTYLSLYDIDGRTLLSSNDDFDETLASRIQWTAPSNGTYYAKVRHWNPYTAGCGTQYLIDLTELAATSFPTVSGIDLASPNPTNDISVDFLVTFSKPVSGVSTTEPFDDFELATTGDITGASIDAVSGSGKTYTVTVNTGNGSGTIQLNVIDNDSIKDENNNPLGGIGIGNGNFTSGPAYTISKNTFNDVPSTYWAWAYIQRLYAARITGGCSVNPLQYCPESTVTRAEMAVFLERGIHGSSFSPPRVIGSTGFSDVPLDYWAAAWIKQLAADQVTAGCGSGNYCPEAPVTRAEMAVFLLKAKHGASYSPPLVGVDTGFGDVLPTHWAGSWIKQLVAEGITAGCGSGNYCPDAAVTRAQMAVFLVKTFNLP